MRFHFEFDEKEIRRNSSDWLRNPGASELVPSIMRETNDEINRSRFRKHWLQSVDLSQGSGGGRILLDPRLTVVEYCWVLDEELGEVEFRAEKLRNPSQAELNQFRRFGFLESRGAGFQSERDDQNRLPDSTDSLRDRDAEFFQVVIREAAEEFNRMGETWLQSVNLSHGSGIGRLYLESRLTVVEFSWILNEDLGTVEFHVERLRRPTQSELNQFRQSGFWAASKLEFHYEFDDQEIRRQSMDWLKNPGAAELISAVSHEAQAEIDRCGEAWFKSVDLSQDSGKASLFLNPRLTVFDFCWQSTESGLIEIRAEGFRNPSQSELNQFLELMDNSGGAMIIARS